MAKLMPRRTLRELRRSTTVALRARQRADKALREYWQTFYRLNSALFDAAQTSDDAESVYLNTKRLAIIEQQGAEQRSQSLSLLVQLATMLGREGK